MGRLHGAPPEETPGGFDSGLNEFLGVRDDLEEMPDGWNAAPESMLKEGFRMLRSQQLLQTVSSGGRQHLKKKVEMDKPHVTSKVTTGMEQ